MSETVFHRHFSSDPGAVANVIGALIARFEGRCLHGDDVTLIEIVLGEVINNINEHAYGGAPNRPIEMHSELADGGIDFLLVDRGKEMPGGALPNGKQPDLGGTVSALPESGFGWFLIRQVAHDLNYVRKNGENHFSFRVTIDSPIITN